jgi:hypothetical protein
VYGGQAIVLANLSRLVAQGDYHNAEQVKYIFLCSSSQRPQEGERRRQKRFRFNKSSKATSNYLEWPLWNEG